MFSPNCPSQYHIQLSALTNSYNYSVRHVLDMSIVNNYDFAVTSRWSRHKRKKIKILPHTQGYKFERLDRLHWQKFVKMRKIFPGSWIGFELLLGGLTACVHFPTTIPVVEMAGQSKVLNWSSASQKKKCLKIFDTASSNYAQKGFSSIRTFLFF